MSNQEIVRQFQDGSSSVFNTIYKTHYPSVERFILNNNGTRDDARDIFQDTMLVLTEKLRADSFELTASLKTYVIAISKNLWFKQLRYARYQNTVEFSDIHSAQFYEDISNSIEQEKTYWERLQAMMSKLTAHCYNLLQSLFIQNKSIEDVQIQYGYTSKHNAQNQKHKCINQARRIKQAQEIMEL